MMYSIGNIGTWTESVRLYVKVTNISVVEKE